MAKEKSRTEYSATNVTVAMVGRVAALLMGFFNRVVFTHTLSADYVGVNGLFTDILNVLSFSELGISTAISFALYAPIAAGDTEQQKSLMALFRKFYQLVACVIFALGLLVIPFMDVIIKDNYEVEHLTAIYLLYLINTCASYLLIYKKTLIDAHQLGYLSTLLQTGSWIIQSALQMLVLFLTGSFYLYLLVWLLSTILSSLLISGRADKLYPFLREKAQLLPRKQRQDIFKNIRAMMLHKIGNVLINNTDNILLSSLVGIVAAGRYSNYWLIIGSIDQLTGQIFTGIAASVGNLGTEKNRARMKRIFEASFFLGQWVFGFCAITLYELLNPFVALSFGENYVFPMSVTLLLCINFYVRGMRQATLVFRDSCGIFTYDKYKAIPEALINLIVSIVLGMRLGALGIFIGTLVSTVTTSLWIEPLVFYKYELHSKVRFYFLRYCIYALMTAGLWVLVDALCGQLRSYGMAGILLRLLVCILVINSAYLLLYSRTPEFMLLKRKACELLHRKKSADAEISSRQRLFLSMLRLSILSKKSTEVLDNLGDKELLSDSISCSLTAVVADAFEQPDGAWENLTKTTEKNNARLTRLSYKIQDILREEGICCLRYKGPELSAYYPKPSHRCFSDVDLLLRREDMEAAVELLCGLGFEKKEKQYWAHHIVLSIQGIKVELHTDFTAPFANEELNRMAESLLAEELERAKRTGEYQLSEYATLTSMYLHMLEHFLTAGMGVKFLVDFTLVCNHGVSEDAWERFLSFVRASKTAGFADIVARTCEKYLGLESERGAALHTGAKTAPEPFLQDVLLSESFGVSDHARISAVTDTSIRGYFLEFHHQMKINYRRYAGIYLLWPLLWMLTLLNFLRNNKTIRGTSARRILQVAGDRGRMIRTLHLWKS